MVTHLWLGGNVHQLNVSSKMYSEQPAGPLVCCDRIVLFISDCVIHFSFTGSLWENLIFFLTFT